MGERVEEGDAEWAQLQELHDNMLRRIGGLAELPMRRAVVREVFDELPPEQTCWLLGQILRGAVWGRNPHIDAMLACALWLVEAHINEDVRLLAALFEAAHDSGKKELLYLFRNPPPLRVLPPESKLPEVRLPIPREVSLGERRTIAAGGKRMLLDRLLYDPSELVIGKLLDNPSIQEQDVLVIASRRPTIKEIVTCVALHNRWVSFHGVREALARNPFGPTGVALAFLPTLHVKALRQIKTSGDLHPTINEFAELLIQLREFKIPTKG